MFDFGFWEMVMILVVALLVVGPQRLPQLARTTGLWVGKIKRMAVNLREELEEEIEAAELKQMLTQQQAEINELRGMLKTTRTEMEAEANQTRAELKETGNLLKAVEEQLSEEISTPAPESSVDEVQKGAPVKNL